MTQTTKQVIQAQQHQAEQERARAQQAQADWGPLEEPQGPEDPEDAFDLQRFTSKGKELVLGGDGDWWSDEASSGARLIRGSLLTYADRQYACGRDKRPMPAGVQLVALSGATAWQRWEGGKPVEVRLRVPGQPFPTRAELGYNDKTQWARRSNGDEIDPWQFTKALYLVDVQSGEIFTFTTTSGGGLSAIADLVDQVMFMRSVRPGACPVIALRYADMDTRHGLKSKPVFHLVGWKGGEVLAKLELPSASEMLDDELPF